MTWSIRARLTAWYSLVVVLVLATGVMAVAVVQDRLALERLDGEINRLMLTLEGVMRTEFSEGLDLQAAADEASVEVVAPDRTLVLTRPDGALLAAWGQPLGSDWRPRTDASTVETLVLGSRRLRLLSRPVAHQGHDYVAAVMAPLEGVESEHNELVRRPGGRCPGRARGRRRGRMARRPADAAAVGRHGDASLLDHGARSLGASPCVEPRRRTGPIRDGVQWSSGSSGRGAPCAAAIHGRCVARTANAGVGDPHDRAGHAGPRDAP